MGWFPSTYVEEDEWIKNYPLLTSSFRDCKNLYLQCVTGLVKYLNRNIFACLNLPVLMLGFIQKFGLTGYYLSQSCARSKLPVCHHWGSVQSPTLTFPEDLWKTKFSVPFHFILYYTMSTSNGWIFNVSLPANICDGTRRWRLIIPYHCMQKTDFSHSSGHKA